MEVKKDEKRYKRIKGNVTVTRNDVLLYLHEQGILPVEVPPDVIKIWPSIEPPDKDQESIYEVEWEVEISIDDEAIAIPPPDVDPTPAIRPDLDFPF